MYHSGTHAIAKSPFRVDELLTAPDGSKLAFMANPINQREEKFDDYEIYVVDLSDVARAPSPANSKSEVQPHRLTHNQAVEHDLHWANDSRHIFFTIDVGDVTGPYRDLQPHLYWVDSGDGKIEQWGKDFGGPVDHYAVTGDNILESARLGTEVQMYSTSKPEQSFHQISDWKGTYASISTSPHSSHVAFLYSSLDKPEESISPTAPPT